MSKATRRFIVNKILEMLITLVVVTLISFLLVRLSPIDPAEAYARRSFAAFSFTDEQMEALREDMGLNEPLPVQYVTWVRDALHLDFGESFVSGQPVFEKGHDSHWNNSNDCFNLLLSKQFSFAVRMPLLLNTKTDDWSCTDFFCVLPEYPFHPFLCQHLPRYFCCQTRSDIGGGEYRADAVSSCGGLYCYRMYCPILTHAGEQY